eukprot:15482695-Alexandrium_andersonii.AAC.1
MRNAALSEVKALLGVATRYGAPWRPVEQAPVEGSHFEAVRERGILLNDVFKAFGHERASVLPVCMFFLYNTPRSSTGLTPRDVDRRWS